MSTPHHTDHYRRKAIEDDTLEERVRIMIEEAQESANKMWRARYEAVAALEAETTPAVPNINR